MDFIPTPKSPASDKIGHYTWCAEQEGLRARLALLRGDVNRVKHYARDAAHWAIRVLDAMHASGKE